MTEVTPEGLNISKEAILELPVKRYEGTIHLIDTDEKLAALESELKSERLLGFDTETRPAFRKGESYLPALVQLGGDNAVYIFQLNSLTFPNYLQEILADKRVIKAGVALTDDVKGLNKKFTFEPAGFVELSTLATDKQVIPNGLRGLAGCLLGIRISKRVKTTNWERKDLSQAQIDYAATDAWVSREIYLKLQEML